MDDSPRLLHQHELNSISGAADVDADHHCHDHAHFTAACESCQRASAAFLPYRNVDPRPDKATRSFQTNMGPANVTVVISAEDQMKMAVTTGVVEGMIDTLFNL